MRLLGFIFFLYSHPIRDSDPPPPSPLSASLSATLPPSPYRLTHTHTHAGKHTRKYTHAPAALSFARSLSLSSHLSHVYTQLADRNVRGWGITDLVQTGKTWEEKIDGGMRVWRREAEWESWEGWQVSVNAALCVRVCDRVLVSISGVVWAHKCMSVFPPLFVSLVCSSVCAETAALQRQKVKSCMDVSQVGWWGESRIMESILLSVS